jgi:hypothetical protein
MLQPKVLDINEVVRESGRMLQRLIPENIIIEIRLDPQAGQVRVDPTQMHQVLLNLAVNARGNAEWWASFDPYHSPEDRGKAPGKIPVHSGRPLRKIGGSGQRCRDG